MQGLFNLIQVTGRGVLKGIGGNKAKFDSVSFALRVEEHGQPPQGGDRYYLRVFSTNGTTLLLVSGDPSNPENSA